MATRWGETLMWVVPVQQAQGLDSWTVKGLVLQLIVRDRRPSHPCAAAQDTSGWVAAWVEGSWAVGFAPPRFSSRSHFRKGGSVPSRLDRQDSTRGPHRPTRRPEGVEAALARWPRARPLDRWRLRPSPFCDRLPGRKRCEAYALACPFCRRRRPFFCGASALWRRWLQGSMRCPARQSWLQMWLRGQMQHRRHSLPGGRGRELSSRSRWAWATERAGSPAHWEGWRGRPTSCNPRRRLPTEPSQHQLFRGRGQARQR